MNLNNAFQLFHCIKNVIAFTINSKNVANEVICIIYKRTLHHKFFVTLLVTILDRTVSQESDYGF